MKVWIVTRGEYSDYHIEAVFSTEERADNFARLISSRYEEASAEEWDLDEPWAAQELYFWDCTIEDYQWDGAVTGKITPLPDEADVVIRPDSEDTEGVRVVAYRGIQFPGYDKLPPHYLVGVRAMDKKVALKIARDKVAQYKAEKEGIA
jgi:hypothetical protein